MVNSIMDFEKNKLYVGTNSPMKLSVKKTPVYNKYTVVISPCKKEEANIMPQFQYLNLSGLADCFDVVMQPNRKGFTKPCIKISKSKDIITIPLNKDPGTLIYDKFRLSSAPKTGIFDGNIDIYNNIEETNALYQVSISNDEKKETLYAVLTPIKDGVISKFPSYSEGKKVYSRNFMNCHYKNFAFTGTISNAINTLLALSKNKSGIKDIVFTDDNGTITLAFKQSCDFCNEEYFSTEHFEKESEQSEICENCNENIDTIEELLDTIKMLIDNQEHMEAKINLLEQKLAEQKADNAKLQKIAKILADT